MSNLQRARATLGAVVAFCVSCALVLAGSGEPGPHARTSAAGSAGTPRGSGERAARGDRGTRPPATAPWRIERSTDVAQGTWTLATKEAAVVIDGARGLVLDLGASELRGAASVDDPSQLTGTAIVVRRSQGVIVRNGRLAGFRFGVRVEDSTDVTVENVVVEDSFAPPLASSEAIASPGDELAHDDAGLFERTGAAFVVLRSTGVRLQGSSARRGAIGVAAVDSPGLVVGDGEFRYLSAFGLALWRSAEATIVHTRVDAAARGVTASARRDARGSAGLLLVDSPAVRVGDSALTRCGSGIVALGASAGLTVARTDLSGAQEHGLELVGVDGARLVELVARDCGGAGLHLEDAPHAWLVECVLERAGAGAIELVRGSDLVLARNWIAGSTVGWSAEDVAGLLCVANGFQSNGLDWEVERCTGLMGVDNVFDPENLLHVTAPGDGGRERDRLRGIGGALPSGRLDACEVLVFEPERAAAFEASLGELERRSGDKRRAPSLGSDGVGDVLRFDRFGPWDPSGARPRPVPRPDGGLLAHAEWDAAWFSWANGPDPRGIATARAGWRELAGTPLERRTVGAWRTPFGDGARFGALPGEQLGLIARTTLALEAGRYRLRVTSDDGVAVRIDGRTVLENWTWHAATLDQVEFEVGAGPHAFELEYFQVDGPSALELELDRL